MSDNESNNIVDFSGKVLTEDDTKKCLDELQKLVMGDHILKTFGNDKTYLLRFLHCTYFNVAAAFKRMQDYYKLLSEHPDWFASTAPLDNVEMIEENSKTVLPDRDKQGRRIFILKLGKINQATASPQLQAQLLDIYAEPFIEQPETLETEVCAILDMKEMSWKLLKFFTPSNIRIAVKKFELYPINKIIVHIINTAPFLNGVITLVWPFFGDRMKEMFKFHFDNWPSLHEHVDPEVLPLEYGGKGSDINFERYHEYLYHNSTEIGQKLKFRNVNFK